MTNLITWFLDPTVAARAVHGRYEAEVWGTGDGETAGYAVFATPARTPLAEGTAPTLDEAKAEAEQVMRTRMGS